VSADTVHCRKLICDEIITPPVLNSNDGVQSFNFFTEQLQEGVNPLYSLQVLQKGNYIFSFQIELGGETVSQTPFNFKVGFGSNSIDKVLYAQSNITNLDKINIAVSYLVVIENDPLSLLLEIDDTSFSPYINIQAQYCRF
jgi:hypothetical protein